MYVMLPILVLFQHKGLMPTPDRSVLIRRELSAIRQLLLKTMEVQKLESLPKFSTSSPPKWADDKLYLGKVLGDDNNFETLARFVSSLYRPWTYETTDDVNGKSYQLLAKSTVIVWVATPMPGNQIGIRKDGSFAEYLKKKG